MTELKNMDSGIVITSFVSLKEKQEVIRTIHKTLDGRQLVSRFGEPAVSYWRVYIPSYNWSYALTTGTNTRDEQAFGTTFFLGKTVPGLKFTTPPANGAAIEASYQLELPFKTSNNLLRFTCSLLLSRGEGS